MSIPTHTLNDGNTLPAVDFGTWPLKGDDATGAVTSAVEARGERPLARGRAGAGQQAQAPGATASSTRP